MDALKTIPSNADRLKTEKGEARLQKTDIFKQLMWFSYFGEDNAWIPVEAKRVKEIQEMNKRGEKPEDLRDLAVVMEELKATEKSFDYENVVGQDSLTRLDEKARKKKNNNRNKNRNNRPTRNTENSGAATNLQKKPNPNNNVKTLPENGEKANQPKRNNRNKKRRNNNNKPDQE
jgi:hypothetical protein